MTARPRPYLERQGIRYAMSPLYRNLDPICEGPIPKNGNSFSNLVISSFANSANCSCALETKEILIFRHDAYSHCDIL